jgi:superfamily II DNA or RNA helicase
MSIKLRDYQELLVNNTRQSFKSKKKRPLIVAPVGAGKTVFFSHMVSLSVKRGNKVLVLAHRDELLDQISTTLRLFKVPHSFISGRRTFLPNMPVQVGSVMTVINRLNLFTPDLIILDEAHHATNNNSFGKIINYYDVFTIGVTATPCRLSGEPLGDVFDDMILAPTMSELISMGYLSDYRLFASAEFKTDNLRMTAGDYNKQDLEKEVDKPQITGSAINEYKNYLSKKRAVVFCVSVKHSENVAAEFMKHNIPSASIDGKMTSTKRKSIIENFKSDKIKVITNCNIITEGFDLPAIEGVILLRPTQSLSLYIQMMGRALRVFQGKTEAIILDHVGNVKRHGLPDQDHEWSLSGSKKRSKKSPDSFSVRICSNCFGANISTNKVCKYCNTPFPIANREIEEVDGTLLEVDKKALRKQKLREQGRASTMDELIQLGISRGYKNPRAWARFVYKSRNK